MEANGKDCLFLEEYQKWVADGISLHIFKFDPTVKGLWATAGLTRESSEAMEIFEKAIRKDHEPDLARLTDELGDVLWYLTACAELNGLYLEDILDHNISKLNARRYTALEEIT